MSQVIWDGLVIRGTLPDGTGQNLLTRDAITGEVGIIPGAPLTNALPNGYVYVGNASNQAAAVPVTGDVTITNTGAIQISPSVIVDADVNSAAAIALTKLAASTPSRIAQFGVTGFLEPASVTTTELGNLSGTISNIQIQLNNKQGTVTGAASTLTTANLTANLALISNASGKVATSSVTATELGFLSGVTSAIQGQLNTKLPVTLGSVAQGDLIYWDGVKWTNFPVGTSGQVLSSTGTTLAWTSAGGGGGVPTGGTAGQYLNKIDGTNYNTQWSTLNLAKVTDVTATAANVNILAGTTVTSAEFNRLSGVTSSIQTQIDSKLARTLSVNAIWVGNASNIPTELAPTTSGYVLTLVGPTPTWQPAPGAGSVSGVAPSTDNAIVRWNGTGATSIQNSGIIIDDSNNATGFATITSNGDVSVLLQKNLLLYDADSSNFVGLRSSAVVGTNYTITLPSAAPASNTFLQYNGATYVWAAGAGGATVFTGLADAPSAYTGAALQYVRVNAGATGLEFAAAVGYSDEQAQDAVGAMLVNSSTVSLTYSDPTPSLTAAVITNSIGNTQLRQGTALSVIGNATNALANVADMVAGTDGHVLRRSGTTLGFGTLPITSTVMNTSRLLGRTTASAGAVEEITVAGGLTLASGTVVLGGTLSGATVIAGAANSFTINGLSNLTLASTATATITSGTASIQLGSGASHILTLGSASGVVFNLGGDATGDMYTRNASGKFVALPIGTVGQTLITSASGVPIWSNTIVEDVPLGSTYTFVAADNGKVKRFLDSVTCTAIIPTGLPTGWDVVALRSGSGSVVLSSAGTLEAVGTTLSAANTAASITHRGSNIHVALGALGGAGAGTVTSVGLAVPAFLSVTGSPITGSGTLTVGLSGTALPPANGGTGLTALGAANRVLGMNNTATALEYKAISTSTAAVANDVGVTLTGANAIVINIPTFSSTVRGVVPLSGGGPNKYLNADGLWTVPAGSGISNTAAVNELMKSDGTNAVPSGVFSATAGDITMGTGLGGSLRTLSATGSAADASLLITSKGAGSVSIDSNSGIVELTRGTLRMGQIAIAGANRTITAIGSATDIALSIIPKIGSSSQRYVSFGVLTSGLVTGSNDIGDIVIGADLAGGSERTISAGTQTGNSVNLGLRSGGGGSGTVNAYGSEFRVFGAVTGGNSGGFRMIVGSTDDQIAQNTSTSALKTFTIISSSGEATTNQNGRALNITSGGGYATTGNGSGGDITLTTGVKRAAGAGHDGNISLFSGLGNITISPIPQASGTLGGIIRLGAGITNKVNIPAGTNITYNATFGESIIILNPTSTATLNLFATSTLSPGDVFSVDGYTLWVKNTGSGSITINANGTNTIDRGSTSMSLAAGKAVMLVMDVTNATWYRMAQY